MVLADGGVELVNGEGVGRRGSRAGAEAAQFALGALRDGGLFGGEADQLLQLLRAP